MAEMGSGYLTLSKNAAAFWLMGAQHMICRKMAVNYFC